MAKNNKTQRGSWDGPMETETHVGGRMGLRVETGHDTSSENTTQYPAERKSH